VRAGASPPTRARRLPGRRAWLTAALVIIGLPLAVGAGKLIAAQLYGVSFWDPLALAAAAGALATCAFVAAIIPAARASSISPMSALRSE